MNHVEGRLTSRPFLADELLRGIAHGVRAIAELLNQLSLNRCRLRNDELIRRVLGPCGPCRRAERYRPGQVTAHVRTHVGPCDANSIISERDQNWM